MPVQAAAALAGAALRLEVAAQVLELARQRQQRVDDLLEDVGVAVRLQRCPARGADLDLLPALDADAVAAGTGLHTENTATEN